MSEYQIIRFCAPTLAGLKTASLFCCDAPDEAELLGQLRHWNTSLAPKGLRMLPLRIWNGRALIYLYRPKALARDLENNWAVVAEGIQTILRREGYPKPYEALKALTRTNAHITHESIAAFIETLDVAETVKEELRALSPATYTGVFGR